MNRVQEKLKSIIEGIEDLNYMFNDWSRANVETELSKAKYPICICDMPDSGLFNIQNNSFRVYPNQTLVFLDKDELDFNSIHNQSIIDRMIEFVKAFISAIIRSDVFEIPDNTISWTAVHHLFDANLSGVLIEIQLKEIIGECL